MNSKELIKTLKQVKKAIDRSGSVLAPSLVQSVETYSRSNPQFAEQLAEAGNDLVQAVKLAEALIDLLEGNENDLNFVDQSVIH